MYISNLNQIRGRESHKYIELIKSCGVTNLLILRMNMMTAKHEEESKQANAFCIKKRIKAANDSSSKNHPAKLLFEISSEKIVTHITV